MNAEEGKKDDCGQKHERKRTISFFILRSGGRIYLLACTADAPFLWLSFPDVSCQARVLMKQKDTGSLSLTPPHPFSASQEHKSISLSSFILFFSFSFFFHQEQDLRYVRSCLIQMWRKNCRFYSHWLPVAVNSCIVCILPCSQCFKNFEQSKF